MHSRLTEAIEEAPEQNAQIRLRLLLPRLRPRRLSRPAAVLLLLLPIEPQVPAAAAALPRYVRCRRRLRQRRQRAGRQLAKEVERLLQVGRGRRAPAAARRLLGTGRHVWLEALALQVRHHLHSGGSGRSVAAWVGLGWSTGGGRSGGS